LLFLEGDGSNVGQVQGGAVNEDELHIGELLGSLSQGSLLQEAGADDDFGAVVGGQLHGVVAVVIGGLVAVGGLIVLVGLAGGGSVQLHAVIGALVEGLVLQGAHVGDESDLILAIAGSH